MKMKMFRFRLHFTLFYADNSPGLQFHSAKYFQKKIETEWKHFPLHARYS